jgi:hypothetical protein
MLALTVAQTNFSLQLLLAVRSSITIDFLPSYKSTADGDLCQLTSAPVHNIYLLLLSDI